MYKSKEYLPKSGRDSNQFGSNTDLTLSSNSKATGTQKRQWKAPTEKSQERQTAVGEFDAQEKDGFGLSGKFGGPSQAYDGDFLKERGLY